jgi:hypothetical protein
MVSTASTTQCLDDSVSRGGRFLTRFPLPCSQMPEGLVKISSGLYESILPLVKTQVESQVSSSSLTPRRRSSPSDCTNTLLACPSAVSLSHNTVSLRLPLRRSRVRSLTRRGRNSTASVFAKGVRVSDPTPVRLFPSPQSATSRRPRLRCSPPSTPRGRTRARR